VSALSYLVLGWEFWGNANSMGAVEGVVAAPVLLWGTLASSSKGLRLRRAVACLGAIYLVYFSITRAAMFASAFSMMTLLICLRRHKLIMKAVAGAFCVLAITAIATPVRFDEMKTSFVEGVVYKGHQDQGLLGSRLPPWQETMRVIQENPLFGSGFGTSFSGDQPFGEPGRFRSAANTNREHGSSYLAITEWVGLLGIVPFLLLIIFALRNVVKVGSYLRRTGDVTNYSVPLMMVVLAGFLHAGFEDWLFAVGYYLTVFFWVAAFLLADLQPESAAYQTAFVHGMRVRYATAPAMTRQ
jgi:O-antigen ligase